MHGIEESAAGIANNMNCEEGHLGGYIRASADPAPSGLRIENGDPATWTPDLWVWCCEELGIESVLDVGCGEGHAARFFRGLGCRVRGVDGSLQARRDSVIPDAHVVHDFVDGAYRPSETFDLVWSCEFVEHVEERFSANFLETFRRSQRYVFMTYAAPGQPGWHHVNCKSAGYWVRKLEDVGFHFDDALSEASRRVAGPGHFQQHGLCFVRGKSAASGPATIAYEENRRHGQA